MLHNHTLIIFDNEAKANREKKNCFKNPGQIF